MDKPEQVLETELKTYEQHKDDLLQRCVEKFVLIKGENILGTFDTKLDAIAVGHQQLGTGPFLVKKVVKVDKPVRIFFVR